MADSAPPAQDKLSRLLAELEEGLKVASKWAEEIDARDRAWANGEVHCMLFILLCPPLVLFLPSSFRLPPAIP